MIADRAARLPVMSSDRRGLPLRRDLEAARSRRADPRPCRDPAGQRRPALQPRLPPLPRRSRAEADRDALRGGRRPAARAARGKPRGRGARPHRRRARDEPAVRAPGHGSARPGPPGHRPLQSDHPGRARFRGSRGLPRRPEGRDRRQPALLHGRQRRPAAGPRHLRRLDRGAAPPERPWIRPARLGARPRSRLQPARAVAAAGAATSSSATTSASSPSASGSSSIAC